MVAAEDAGGFLLLFSFRDHLRETLSEGVGQLQGYPLRILKKNYISPMRSSEPVENNKKHGLLGKHGYGF